VGGRRLGRFAVTTARGDFDIDRFDSDEYADVDGTSLARVSIAKTFRGDLEGQGSVTMLSARAPVETSAVYVALERVDARLHGRNGSFVLRHDGLTEAGENSLSVIVVPDSATGELTGLRGDFHIDIEPDGTHHYRFDYELPDA